MFELQVCEHGKFYIQFTERYECMRACVPARPETSEPLVINWFSWWITTQTHSIRAPIPFFPLSLSVSHLKCSFARYRGNLGLGSFNLKLYENTNPISYGRFNYSYALHFSTVKCTKIELGNMAQAQSLDDCKNLYRTTSPFSPSYGTHQRLGFEMLLLCAVNTPNQEFR